MALKFRVHHDPWRAGVDRAGGNEDSFPEFLIQRFDLGPEDRLHPSDADAASPGTTL